MYRNHLTLGGVSTSTCEDVSEDKVNWASCMAMAEDAGDTSEDAGVDPGISVCIEP